MGARDPSPPLDALAEVIREDARSAARRLRDRAANEARAAVLAAEEHVAALEEATRDLGRARGFAAKEAYEREADVEIREVLGGAFDRLVERFERELETALEGLRSTDRHAEALRAWARSAAATMQGPSDVHTAPEDRDAVYEALLEAGAEDFQVHLDRSLRIGFVVRDLDGRTLLDRTPAAIVRLHRTALGKLLRARVPKPPTSDRGG